MNSRNVDRPAAPQIGLHARSIAPACGSDPLRRKAAIFEEVAESRLGPSRTVQWARMDLDQERGGDQESAARPEHRKDVSSGAIGIRNVLEDLLGNHKIELILKAIRAYIELGKVDASVAAKVPMSRPVFARDLQCIKRLRLQCIDPLASRSIQHDSLPLLVRLGISREYPRRLYEMPSSRN